MLESLLAGGWLVWLAGNVFFHLVVIIKLFGNNMAPLAWCSIFFVVPSILISGLFFLAPMVAFLIGWFYSTPLECKRWMCTWTIWFFAPLLLLSWLNILITPA